MLPSLNLLLLPLLGGYLYLSRSDRWRVANARADRTRLFLSSAVAGVVLLFIARLLVLLLGFIDRGLFASAFTDLWSTLVPLPHSGTATLSLVLGGLLSPIDNLWFSRTDLALRKEDVRVHGNALENLFLRSMERIESDADAVMAITLMSRKVYIGWAVRQPQYKDSEDAFVRFLPLMSGYRRTDSLELEITSFYEDEIRRRRTSSEVSPARDVELVDQLSLVFPVQSIQSANFFDIETYTRISAEQTAAGQEKGQPPGPPVR